MTRSDDHRPITRARCQGRAVTDLVARDAVTARVLLGILMGHPAGDALLARLGSGLATATASDGPAYRVGGDEFVLAPWPADQAPDALVERARAALCEQGDGFAIGASAGYAMLPGGAGDADEAMRVADRRLYAEKNSGRMSARLQSAGVLRSALSEWDPELAGHTNEVAALAIQVARGLGLDEDDIERVAIAADLHDIDKDRHPPLDLAQARPTRCRGVEPHAPPHPHRRAHRAERPGARRRLRPDPLEPRTLGRRRLSRSARGP
jgi:hypothetical protein